VIRRRLSGDGGHPGGTACRWASRRGWMRQWSHQSAPCSAGRCSSSGCLVARTVSWSGPAFRTRTPPRARWSLSVDVRRSRAGRGERRCLATAPNAASRLTGSILWPPCHSCPLGPPVAGGGVADAAGCVRPLQPRQQSDDTTDRSLPHTRSRMIRRPPQVPDGWW